MVTLDFNGGYHRILDAAWLCCLVAMVVTIECNSLSVMVSFMQSQESRQWGISDGISSMGTTDYYMYELTSCLGGGGGGGKKKKCCIGVRHLSGRLIDMGFSQPHHISSLSGHFFFCHTSFRAINPRKQFISAFCHFRKMSRTKL